MAGSSAKRFGRLEVMTSSNFVGCSMGRSPGLGALEDLVDVDGGMAELVGVVRAIAGQAPRFHIFTGADDVGSRCFMASSKSRLRWEKIAGLGTIMSAPARFRTRWRTAASISAGLCTGTLCMVRPAGLAATSVPFTLRRDAGFLSSHRIAMGDARGVRSSEARVACQPARC